MKNFTIVAWMAAYFVQARDLVDDYRKPHEPKLSELFPKDWTQSTCIEGTDDAPVAGESAADEYCELSKPVDRELEQVTRYREEMMA